jgi:carbamoyltransferase
MAMNVLGVMAFGENPAACLLRDGELVAFAEEERFTRLKGSDGMCPSRSIAYCLSAAGLPLAAVDRIAFGWNCRKYPWTMLRRFAGAYLRHRGAARRAYRVADEGSSGLSALEAAFEYHPGRIRSRLVQGLRAAGLRGEVPPIEFVDHHLAHAYSAYYCSGFRRAGILTLDGSGEDVCTQLAVGEDDEVRVVEQVGIPNSLGWFYAAITQYLGFIPYRDEGKLMGLAALGEERCGANRWLDPLSRVLRISGDGYEVDPIYTRLGGHYDGDRFTDELTRLITSVDPTAVPVAYGERVRHDGEVISRYLLDTYVDLAWAAQTLLEEAAVTLARRLVREQRVENLCLAGGVALNCKMNGEVLRHAGCRNVFVQPAASDAGSALGAAMYVGRQLGDDVRNPLTHVRYGPGFDDDAVHRALRQCGVSFRRVADPAEEAAERLEEGSIVGWVQGRMEFGARALGGRSILANLAVPGIKDRVNARVKYRESWRPFCPSLIEEVKDRYIESPNESSFMTVAYRATPEAVKALPAIVHVDGTMRPQVVASDVDPLYHRLIAEVGRRTGHPVVMNTSLNVRSEPIVCTPLEAVRCYYSNGLDALIIGNFALTKK